MLPNAPTISKLNVPALMANYIVLHMVDYVWKPLSLNLKRVWKEFGMGSRMKYYLMKTVNIFMGS